MVVMQLPLLEPPVVPHSERTQLVGCGQPAGGVGGLGWLFGSAGWLGGAGQTGLPADAVGISDVRTLV